uniref:Skp1_POZ domain-containing protein n=1 Tax=Caenorhabditis tropicalis TaxID=1561998 RepID=A0A1I7UC81_9PELO
MSNQKVYKFESSDKQIFQMTSEDVDQSVTLSKAVDAYEKSPSDPGVIPIKKMPGEIMKMVAKWFEMHRMETQSTSTWPEDYLRSMTENQFNDFLWAAEHLVINSILWVMKKEMLRRMKAKRPLDYERIFESEKLEIKKKGVDKVTITVKKHT